ncbi:hypothetical protein Tco_0678546 [Tanacetum coccineum]|uniref:Uncharacterized protein n=1 Tax=Tanacetum coccineum TaxID=301880 RepID=A0ABQ4XFY2_9ASTR
MEECHKMLTDQIDWANPEGDKDKVDISKPLPLSGPLGTDTPYLHDGYAVILIGFISLELLKTYTGNPVKEILLKLNLPDHRKEERVRLLVGSPGASTTPIYSPGSSSTPIYSSGSSTPPRYSSGASIHQSYSPGSSRNVECSNCKHLLDKITVLEATMEMYMHPEQHTVNSAALLHKVYNDMRKLDLELFVIWNVISMLPCLKLLWFF